MPAAIVRQPNLTYYSEFFATTTPAHSVYGFGITPLGFTFDFERAHKVYPFAQIDGGIIASTESIPDNIANTSALNFLFDFGGGVKWRPNDRYAFTFGYKFLHISNAGTTSVNPGLDNNLVYAGQIGTAEQIDFSALDIHQEGIGTKMSDLVFKAEGRNANPTYDVGIVSQIQARREEV